MKIILGIFIFLVVFGMISEAIEDWFSDEWPVIVLVVLFIAVWHFWGFIKAIIFAIVVVAAIKLVSVIIDKIKENNEKEFNQYLEKHCRSMGRLTTKQWADKLPQFANRIYTTSFPFITDNFAKHVEADFFENSKNLSWVDPYVNYLKTNIMATVYELEKVSNSAMQTTHYSPDGKLIYDALSGLQKYKKINGAAVLEKVQLDPDAVKQLLPTSFKGDIPEYYQTSFKLSDAYSTAHNITSDHFESEEISLDDLENME
uniref:hypothetical protein n=1 Tax=Gemmiger formicilis TaxID=745368 RepID=UPI003FEF5DAC